MMLSRLGWKLGWNVHSHAALGVGPLILLLSVAQAGANASFSLIAASSSDPGTLGLGTANVYDFAPGTSITFDVMIQSDEQIPFIFISVRSPGNVVTDNSSEPLIMVGGVAWTPMGSLPASGTDTSADIIEVATTINPAAVFATPTKIGAVTFVVTSPTYVWTGLFNPGDLVEDATSTDISATRVTFGTATFIPEPMPEPCTALLLGVGLVGVARREHGTE